METQRENRCPSCGHDNRADRRFCTECGGRLGVVCPACRAPVETGEKFCGACGAALTGTGARRAEPSPASYTPKHLAEKILASKSALEGERKQVTVLFADVKGSMELAEQVDAEEWHRILDRFFQLLADGVHRFEGTVNQYTGDGIMALFGAPIAHEDHAQRACYAALALRDALRSHAQELRRERGLDFSVRMGLNSGEVVVGTIGDDLRMDYTAQGHVVGLAQRMEQLAEAGRVYLAEATATLVRGYVALEDLGAFAVKGIAVPLRVYALEGIGEHRTRLERARARGLSRFVGRDAEMASLEAALGGALAGQGQVVGIVAEAGTGKSRLCHELAERCRQRGILVRSAQGVAHGKAVPLLPMLEFYREAFGITAADTDREARQKIAGAVVLLEDDVLREWLPLLFEFLGVPDASRPAPRIDPETRERRLLDLLRRLSVARSRQEPAVLVFEDLHWIDAATERFVEALADATEGARTLLVVNFRPEYAAEWMHRSDDQQLGLRPLDRTAVAELLAEWRGADPSFAGLAERIQERTRGNPFFVDEIIQSLIESGALEGARGRYRLARPVATLDIPATVQALLAARIDRLPEREKGLLQTAAVLGDEFTEALLGRVSGLPPAELRDGLRHLVAAELVYEQALYPDPEYAFKHPQTREVAYGSQLAARRARVHAAVAQALEEGEAKELDQRAALLAHHWEEAGEALVAARWHHRAALRATIELPPQGMLHHPRKIRELTSRLPPSPEVDQLGTFARVQLLVWGARLGAEADEMAALFREGEELARRRGDTGALTRLLGAYGLYRVYHDGTSDALVADLEEAVRIADETDDLALQVAVRWPLVMAWECRDHRAQLRISEEALVRCEQDRELGAEALGYPPWAAFMTSKCNALQMLGRLAECAPLSDAMLAFARGYPSGLPMFLAHATAAGHFADVGEAERALSHARQGMEVSELLGGPALLIVAYPTLAFACLRSGDFDAAVASYEEGLALIRAHAAFRQYEARYGAALAQARLCQGEADLARGAAERAVETARQRGTPAFETQAQVVLARAVLRVEGPAARAVVEAALARAETLIEQTGSPRLAPDLHEARAELAHALGDPTAHARHLREAQRLYTAMGARGLAERVARELGP